MLDFQRAFGGHVDVLRISLRIKKSTRGSKTWQLTNGKVLSKKANEIPGWRSHICDVGPDGP